MTTVAAPTSQIRVLLIEDHFLARIALQSVLMAHNDILLEGQASDGEQGLQMCRELLPDVIILDLRLPRLSGFEVMSALANEPNAPKIVVLSNYQGSEDIYRAIRSGAAAYLTKDASGDEVVVAIESVHRGQRYFSRVAMEKLADRMNTSELTPRERDVLSCITDGLSNREIAEKLIITEKTVRIHVSSLLEKMGARDRTQATILAVRRGIVHLE